MIPIVAETREKFRAICATYKIPYRRAKFLPVKKFLAATGQGATPDIYIDYEEDSVTPSRT